ncbi:pecanex-like protein 4 [Haemaphysalis longicornis]
MDGDAAELISGSKLGFAGRRLLGTLLGGLTVGPPLPLPVRSALFLWPLAAGGALAAAVECAVLGLGAACSLAALTAVAAALAATLADRRGPRITPALWAKHGVQELPWGWPGRTAAEVLVGALAAGAAAASVAAHALPSQMESRWRGDGIPRSGRSAAVGWCLCVLTWLSACVSLWAPVTGRYPTEPAAASYGSANSASWSRPLFRPFYLLLVTAALPHLLRGAIRAGDGLLRLADVSAVLLPLLFVLGALPPLEALALWLPEWLLTNLLAGSAAPSFVRTCSNLCLSSGMVAVDWLATNRLLAAELLCLGAVLGSINLGEASRHLRCPGQGGAIRCRSFFLQTCVGVGALGMAGLADAWRPDRWALTRMGAPTFVVMLVVGRSCAGLQAAYMMAGCVRSPCFPRKATLEAVARSRKRARIACAVRTLVLSYGAPLLLTFYVSAQHRNTAHRWSVWTSLASVFAYKLVWLDCDAALLSVLVAELLRAWTFTAALVQRWSPLTTLLVAHVARSLCSALLARVAVMGLFCARAKPRRLATCLAAVNVLALPALLFVALAAAVLAAPVLPLFTLPVFLPTFPRPRRFWPQQSKQAASQGRDGSYYRQLVPHVKAALADCFRRGTLGRMEAGSFFLGRLDSYLVLVQVLEAGLGFRTVCLKGLELQEQTSCHAAEAAKVDEMFERVASQERALLNPEPWHVLLPLDLAPVTAYTSSSMVLTGVIDSADFLDTLPTLFQKCLLWTLIGQRLNDLQSGCAEVQPTLAAAAEDDLPDSWEDPVCWASPFNSASWSDSDDPLEDGPTSSTKKTADGAESQAAVVTSTSSRRPASQLSWATKRGLHFPTELPKVRVVSATTEMSPPREWLEFAREKAPRPPPGGAARLFSALDGGEGWWRAVLQHYSNRMSHKARKESEEATSSRRLFLQYSGLVALCLGLLLPTDRSLQPGDVVAGFCGDKLRVAASTARECRLVESVIRGWRYSTKLCLDHVLVGPAGGDRGLLEQLDELSSGWHLDSGQQTPAWQEAVRAETPHLLSLHYDPVQEEYRSERLSLGRHLLSLGRLSAQAVQSIWASLSLELFYLANDDDERYSIQADPTLLRNLIVQAADPPLGYPLFNSGPIVIDTF